MTTLLRDDSVFVLKLGTDENRFNADSIAAINDALDEVEGAAAPKGLVTTGHERFYSNGLDLDWMSSTEDDIGEFLRDVHIMLGRVLTIGLPTASAINGHAFAGGAMLAAAHDHRVMRHDRGYWCLPEVDLGMRFTPGMTALLTARVPSAAIHRAMVCAERFGGDQAAMLGIVEEAVDDAALLETAVAWAEANSHRAGPVLAAIKRDLYPDAHRLLHEGAGPAAVE